MPRTGSRSLRVLARASLVAPRFAHLGEHYGPLGPLLTKVQAARFRHRAGGGNQRLQSCKVMGHGGLTP
jgi:hypothetical protein